MIVQSSFSEDDASQRVKSYYENLILVIWMFWVFY